MQPPTPTPHPLQVLKLFAASLRGGTLQEFSVGLTPHDQVRPGKGLTPHDQVRPGKGLTPHDQVRPGKGHDSHGSRADSDGV